MSCTQFIGNLEGLNCGQDFPKDLLKVCSSNLYAHTLTPIHANQMYIEQNLCCVCFSTIIFYIRRATTCMFSNFINCYVVLLFVCVCEVCVREVCVCVGLFLAAWQEAGASWRPGGLLRPAFSEPARSPHPVVRRG